MSYDRSDWNALKSQRATDRLRGSRAELELLAQAQVRSELLTNLPEWDLYLQFVQGAIDKTVEQRDAWLARMTNPDLSDDEAARLRRYVLILNERVTAWTAVMALPSDIQKQGEAAEDLLSRVRAIEET